MHEQNVGPGGLYRMNDNNSNNILNGKNIGKMQAVPETHATSTCSSCTSPFLTTPPVSDEDFDHIECNCTY
jgi:hypothetical protein